MELKTINAETLDRFVAQCEKAHFMQTSGWAEVASSRHYITHLLGLYDQDVLKGTALLLERKVAIYSTFYCPRGFMTDYHDKTLVKEFLGLLKVYVRKHNGLYLRFDPDLIIRKLDDEAGVKETIEENLEYIDFFKSLGCRHRGFTTKFSETSAPRFTFRVNVDRDENEMIDSFHGTTRKILRRDNPYGLTIRKGNGDDVESFYKTMEETARRKKIILEPKSFFTGFYSILSSHDMSDIFVVECDVAKTKSIMKNKIAQIESEKAALLDRPESKKRNNQLSQLNDALVKANKELGEIETLKEEKIILCSIITARFKDMVWLIHGGNRDDLMFLNANYELYFSIMKDAHANGYKTVDFYGSEGVVDKSSPIYGIYLFKLRFGGDFDEFSGEYDLVTRPLANAIIGKLLHIRRRLLIARSVAKN